MMKRTITLYPNELRGRIDPAAEPTLEVLGGKDSFGQTLNAGDQAADLLDYDRAAQLTVSTNGQAGKPRIDVALTKRLAANFVIYDGINLRDVYPAAMRNAVRLCHNSTDNLGTATEVAAEKVVSGLLQRGRPHLHFDGVAAKVTVTDAPSLDFGYGDGAIEALIYMPDKSQSVRWYSRIQDANNYVYFRYNAASNWLQAYFYVGGTSLHHATCSWTPTANTWYHVVWTWQNGVSNALYIDGLSKTLLADTKTGGNMSLTASLTMSYGVGVAYYRSKMRRMRQFNRHLSQADVTNLYNGEPLGAADQWGAMTAIYTSNFSAGTDGWVKNTAEPTFLVEGNIDGIAGVNDNLRCRADGQDDCAMQIISDDEGLEEGYYYQAIFDYYCDPGSGLANLGIGVNGARTAKPDGGYANVPIVEGSWQTNKKLTLVEDVATGKLRIAAFTTADGQTVDYLISERNIYFKNIVVRKIGCTGEWNHDGISKGQSKWFDGSANNMHGAVVGCEYVDAPDDDNPGYLLLRFSEFENAYLFNEFNPDGLTGVKDLLLGQICKAMSLTLSGVREFDEDVEYSGIDKSEAYGGSELPTVRYEGERRFWPLLLVGQTREQVGDMRQVYRAQKGQKAHFYLEETWEGEEPVLYGVKFDGLLSIKRTGNKFEVQVPIREVALEE